MRNGRFPPLGFVKLIVGPDGDDRIFGIRAIGWNADAPVAAASIMIEQTLPYTYILDSIMPHPSLMECLQGAAYIVAGDALIPKVGDIDSFHHLHGAVSLGAVCAVVLAHHKRAATPRDGPEKAALRGAYCPPGGVAALARCPASRRAPRLPRGKIRTHETGRYYRPLV